MKKVIARFVPLLLVACSPAPTEADGAPAADSANPHVFEIDLTFTPRAAEKLVELKERVVVDAMYFGLAKSADAPGVDEHGMEVGLGSDAVEVDPVNARVKTPGTGFDSTHITSITGEPEVLVNVYSARKTQEHNILSCGLYQGPVAMAQKQPIAISCDLIEAPDIPAVR